MGVGDFVYNAIASAGATSTVSGFDVQISGNTSGTTALVSSGTLTLIGGNNVTLSQNGNSIAINAGEGTVSFFQPPWPGTPTFASTLGQSSLYLSPMKLGVNLSATRAHIAFSLSLSSSSNSSMAATLSFDMGIYTRSGSTLNLLTSGGTNYQFTNTSGNSSASLTGARVVSVPMNINLTPGDYWVAFLSQTNTAGANWISLSNLLQTGVSIVGTFMAATNSTGYMVPGMGHLNSATVACPATIDMNAIVGTAARDGLPPVIWFLNATV